LNHKNLHFHRSKGHVEVYKLLYALWKHIYTKRKLSPNLLKISVKLDVVNFKPVYL